MSFKSSKGKPRLVSKTCAIFLSLCLILSESFLYAADIATATQQITNTPSFSTPFSLPDELGSVDEFFQGDSANYIIYIQDAHDSLEAQENIAGMITNLVKRDDIKTVFEEGHEGPVPSDEYFGFMQDPEVKEAVSYFMMDKLRIGGAEYAHINRTTEFDLIGVDSIDLHRKNVKMYQETAATKEQTDGDLKEIARHIKKLTNQFFPKEIKSWMKLKKRFDQEKLNLLDYLKRVLPQVTNDPQVVANRYLTISLILAAEKTKDKQILKEVEAVDAQTLFAEIHQLESDLAARYLQEERDLKIFEFYQALLLFQKLGDIEITPEQYQAVKETLTKIDTRKLARFIVEHTGKTVVLAKRWEKNIQSAMRFYDIAYERDHQLEITFDQFRDKGDGQAILVFGGFHKGAITDILKKKKITHYVVTPRITSISQRHRKFYKQLMSVGHHDFEISDNVARASRAIPAWGEDRYPGLIFDLNDVALLPKIRSEIRKGTDKQLIIRQMEKALEQRVRSEVRMPDADDSENQPDQVTSEQMARLEELTAEREGAIQVIRGILGNFQMMTAVASTEPSAQNPLHQVTAGELADALIASPGSIPFLVNERAQRHLHHLRGYPYLYKLAVSSIVESPAFFGPLFSRRRARVHYSPALIEKEIEQAVSQKKADADPLEIRNEKLRIVQRYLTFHFIRTFLRYENREYSPNLPVMLTDGATESVLQYNIILMQNLYDLSRILLQVVYDINYEYLANQYGRPSTTGSMVLGGSHSRMEFPTFDYDVVFLYGKDGTTRGGPQGSISNREFFNQLAREIQGSMQGHGSLSSGLHSDRIGLAREIDGRYMNSIFQEYTVENKVRGSDLWAISLEDARAGLSGSQPVDFAHSFVLLSHGIGDESLSQGFIELATNYLDSEERLLSAMAAVYGAYRKPTEAEISDPMDIKNYPGSLRSMHQLIWFNMLYRRLLIRRGKGVRPGSVELYSPRGPTNTLSLIKRSIHDHEEMKKITAYFIHYINLRIVMDLFYARNSKRLPTEQVTADYFAHFNTVVYRDPGGLPTFFEGGTSGDQAADFEQQLRSLFRVSRETIDDLFTRILQGEIGILGFDRASFTVTPQLLDEPTLNAELAAYEEQAQLQEQRLEARRTAIREAEIREEEKNRERDIALLTSFLIRERRMDGILAESRARTMIERGRLPSEIRSVLQQERERQNRRSEVRDSQQEEFRKLFKAYNQRYEENHGHFGLQLIPMRRLNMVHGVGSLEDFDFLKGAIRILLPEESETLEPGPYIKDSADFQKMLDILGSDGLNLLRSNERDRLIEVHAGLAQASEQYHREAYFDRGGAINAPDLEKEITDIRRRYYKDSAVAFEAVYRLVSDLYRQQLDVTKSKKVRDLDEHFELHEETSLHFAWRGGYSEGKRRVIRLKPEFAADTAGFLSAHPEKNFKVFEYAKVGYPSHELIKAFYANRRDFIKWVIEERRKPEQSAEFQELNASFVKVMGLPSGKQRLLSRSLWTMHRVGLLAAFLPEYRWVRHLVSNPEFHDFTVDQHILHTLDVLDRVRPEEPSAFRHIQKEYLDLEKAKNRDELVAFRLALLLHDTGKNFRYPGSPDHAIKAAQDIVPQRLAEMGIAAEERQLAAWLVRYHMMLNGYANKWLDDDPDALPRVVELLVKDPYLNKRRLQLLYLVSLADRLSGRPLEFHPHPDPQLVLSEPASQADAKALRKIEALHALYGETLRILETPKKKRPQVLADLHAEARAARADKQKEFLAKIPGQVREVSFKESAEEELELILDRQLITYFNEIHDDEVKTDEIRAKVREAFINGYDRLFYREYVELFPLHYLEKLDIEEHAQRLIFIAHLEVLRELEIQIPVLFFEQSFNRDYERHTELIVGLPSDEAGIFAHVSGALWLNDFSVHGASFRRSPDTRLIVDRVFGFVTKKNQDMEAYRRKLWADMRHAIHVARGEHGAVRGLFERDEKDYVSELPEYSLGIPTEVSWNDPTTLDGTQVVSLDIETADRPGLLHLISLILFFKGYRIHSAPISTFGVRARNRFLISRSDHQPVTPAHQQELSSALREVLEEQRVVLSEIPARMIRRSEIRTNPNEILTAWAERLTEFPDQRGAAFWSDQLNLLSTNFGWETGRVVEIPRILAEFDQNHWSSALRIVDGFGEGYSANGYSVAAFFDPSDSDDLQAIIPMSQVQQQIVDAFGADKIVLVPSGYDSQTSHQLSDQGSLHLTLKSIEHGLREEIFAETAAQKANGIRETVENESVVEGELIGPFWHKNQALVMIWRATTPENKLYEIRDTLDKALPTSFVNTSAFHVTLGYHIQGRFDADEFRGEYAKLAQIPVVRIPVKISRFEVNGYTNIAFINPIRSPDAVLNLKRSEVRDVENPATQFVQFVMSRPKRTIRSAEAVARSFVYSPNRRFLAIENSNRRIRLFDSQTEEYLDSLGSDIVTVNYLGGNQAILVDSEGKMRFLDLETGEPVTLGGQSMDDFLLQGPEQISVSEDGRAIAILYRNGLYVDYINLDQNYAGRIPMTLGYSARGIEMSGDGKWLTVSWVDRNRPHEYKTQIHDLEKRVPLATDRDYSYRISADGKMLLGKYLRAGIEPAVALDARTGSVITSGTQIHSLLNGDLLHVRKDLWVGTYGRGGFDFQEGFENISFDEEDHASSGGRFLLGTHVATRGRHIFDARTRKPLNEDFDPSGIGIDSVVFTPNDSRAIVIYKNGTVAVFDLAIGDRDVSVQSLPLRIEQGASNFRMVRGGRYLEYTVTLEGRSYVRLVDIASGESLLDISAIDYSFSPSGNWVVVQTRTEDTKQVTARNIRTDQNIELQWVSDVSHVSFSPGENWIVARGHDEISGIYHVENGVNYRLAVTIGTGGIPFVEFVNDDTELLVFDRNGEVHRLPESSFRGNPELDQFFEQWSRYLTRGLGLIRSLTDAGYLSTSSDDEAKNAQLLQAISGFVDSLHVQDYFAATLVDLVFEPHRYSSLDDLITNLSDLERFMRQVRMADEGMVAAFLDMPSAERRALLDSWDAELESIRDGNFDRQNPAHALIGFVLLTDEFQDNPAVQTRPSFEAWLSVLQSSENARQSIRDALDPKQLAEIRYLNYEQVRLRTFILGLKEKIDQLNGQRVGRDRPLVIVENLSYGWVASFPLEDELRALGIRIVRTKAGSTFAHNHPWGMHGSGKRAADDNYLLNDADLQYIIENEAYVFVIDGSYSVDALAMQNRRRKDARIPDAHQIWRNNAHAWSGIPDPAALNIDGLMLQDGSASVDEAIQRYGLYQDLRGRINGIREADERPAYGMMFWYPGEQPLNLHSERVPRDMPERANLSNLANPLQPHFDKLDQYAGPVMIMGLANIENALIPDEIRSAKPADDEHAGLHEDASFHHSAYWDDKQLAQIMIRVTPTGPKIEDVFVSVVRAGYESEKKRQRVPEIEPVASAAQEDIQVQVVVADYDDTLVKYPEVAGPLLKNRLERLLRKGMPIAIITEEHEPRLEERLWGQIDPSLRRHLYIMSNGGSQIFGFDANGNKKVHKRYRIEEDGADLRSRMVNIITQTLPAGSYSIEHRDHKLKIKFRRRRDRSRQLEALDQAFREAGIHMNVWKRRRNRIDVSPWFKPEAARYFNDNILPNYSTSLQNVLVLANSIGAYRGDSSLFAALDLSLRVNVGREDHLQHGETLYQLDDQGPDAAGQLLDMVDQNNGRLSRSDLLSMVSNRIHLNFSWSAPSDSRDSRGSLADVRSEVRIVGLDFPAAELSQKVLGEQPWELESRGGTAAGVAPDATGMAEMAAGLLPYLLDQAGSPDPRQEAADLLARMGSGDQEAADRFTAMMNDFLSLPGDGPSINITTSFAPPAPSVPAEDSVTVVTDPGEIAELLSAPTIGEPIDSSSISVTGFEPPRNPRELHTVRIRGAEIPDNNPVTAEQFEQRLRNAFRRISEFTATQRLENYSPGLRALMEQLQWFIDNNLGEGTDEFTDVNVDFNPGEPHLLPGDGYNVQMAVNRYIRKVIFLFVDNPERLIELDERELVRAMLDVMTVPSNAYVRDNPTHHNLRVVDPGNRGTSHSLTHRDLDRLTDILIPQTIEDSLARGRVIFGNDRMEAFLAGVHRVPLGQIFHVITRDMSSEELDHLNLEALRQHALEMDFLFENDPHSRSIFNRVFDQTYPLIRTPYALNSRQVGSPAYRLSHLHHALANNRVVEGAYPPFMQTMDELMRRTGIRFMDYALHFADIASRLPENAPAYLRTVDFPTPQSANPNRSGSLASFYLALDHAFQEHHDEYVGVHRRYSSYPDDIISPFQNMINHLGDQWVDYRDALVELVPRYALASADVVAYFAERPVEEFVEFIQHQDDIGHPAWLLGQWMSRMGGSLAVFARERSSDLIFTAYEVANSAFGSNNSVSNEQIAAFHTRFGLVSVIVLGHNAGVAEEILLGENPQTFFGVPLSFLERVYQTLEDTRYTLGEGFQHPSILDLGNSEISQMLASIGANWDLFQNHQEDLFYFFNRLETYSPHVFNHFFNQSPQVFVEFMQQASVEGSPSWLFFEWQANHQRSWPGRSSFQFYEAFDILNQTFGEEPRAHMFIRIFYDRFQASGGALLVRFADQAYELVVEVNNPGTVGHTIAGFYDAIGDDYEFNLEGRGTLAADLYEGFLSQWGGNFEAEMPQALAHARAIASSIDGDNTRHEFWHSVLSSIPALNSARDLDPDNVGSVGWTLALRYRNIPLEQVNANWQRARAELEAPSGALLLQDLLLSIHDSVMLPHPEEVEETLMNVVFDPASPWRSAEHRYVLSMAIYVLATLSADPQLMDFLRRFLDEGILDENDNHFIEDALVRIRNRPVIGDDASRFVNEVTVEILAAYDEHDATGLINLLGYDQGTAVHAVIRDDIMNSFTQIDGGRPFLVSEESGGVGLGLYRFVSFDAYVDGRTQSLLAFSNYLSEGHRIHASQHDESVFVAYKFAKALGYGGEQPFIAYIPAGFYNQLAKAGRVTVNRSRESPELSITSDIPAQHLRILVLPKHRFENRDVRGLIDQSDDVSVLIQDNSQNGFLYHPEGLDVPGEFIPDDATGHDRLSEILARHKQYENTRLVVSLDMNFGPGGAVSRRQVQNFFENHPVFSVHFQDQDSADMVERSLEGYLKLHLQDHPEVFQAYWRQRLIRLGEPQDTRETDRQGKHAASVVVYNGDDYHQKLYDDHSHDKVRFEQMAWFLFREAGVPVSDEVHVLSIDGKPHLTSKWINGSEVPTNVPEMTPQEQAMDFVMSAWIQDMDRGKHDNYLQSVPGVDRQVWRTDFGASAAVRPGDDFTLQTFVNMLDSEDARGAFPALQTDDRDHLIHEAMQSLVSRFSYQSILRLVRMSEFEDEELAGTVLNVLVQSLDEMRRRVGERNASRSEIRMPQDPNEMAARAQETIRDLSETVARHAMDDAGFSADTTLAAGRTIGPNNRQRMSFPGFMERLRLLRENGFDFDRFQRELQRVVQLVDGILTTHSLELGSLFVHETDRARIDTIDDPYGIRDIYLEMLADNDGVPHDPNQGRGYAILYAIQQYFQFLADHNNLVTGDLAALVSELSNRVLSWVSNGIDDAGIVQAVSNLWPTVPEPQVRYLIGVARAAAWVEEVGVEGIMGIDEPDLQIENIGVLRDGVLRSAGLQGDDLVTTVQQGVNVLTLVETNEGNQFEAHVAQAARDALAEIQVALGPGITDVWQIPTTNHLSRSEVRTDIPQIAVENLIQKVPGKEQYPTYVLADPLYDLFESPHLEGSGAMALHQVRETDPVGGSVVFTRIKLAEEIGLPGAKELAQIIETDRNLIVLRQSKMIDPLGERAGAKRDVAGKPAEEHRKNIIWEERMHLDTALLEGELWQNIIDVTMGSKHISVEGTRQSLYETMGIDAVRDDIVTELLPRILIHSVGAESIADAAFRAPFDVADELIELRRESEPDDEEAIAAARLAEQMEYPEDTPSFQGFLYERPEGLHLVIQSVVAPPLRGLSKLTAKDYTTFEDIVQHVSDKLFATVINGTKAEEVDPSDLEFTKEQVHGAFDEVGQQIGMRRADEIAQQLNTAFRRSEVREENVFANAPPVKPMIVEKFLGRDGGAWGTTEALLTLSMDVLDSMVRSEMRDHLDELRVIADRKDVKIILYGDRGNYGAETEYFRSELRHLSSVQVTAKGLTEALALFRKPSHTPVDIRQRGIVGDDRYDGAAVELKDVPGDMILGLIFSLSNGKVPWISMIKGKLQGAMAFAGQIQQMLAARIVEWAA